MKFVLSASDTVSIVSVYIEINIYLLYTKRKYQRCLQWQSFVYCIIFFILAMYLN